MKQLFVVLFTLISLILTFIPTSHACGSKFLVKGFKLNKSQSPRIGEASKILIYLAPQTDAVEDALDRDFQYQLNAMGHAVYLVESLEDLNTVLKEDRAIDLVICGLPAIGEAERALHQAGVQAVLMPVVEQDKPEEVTAARAKFGSVIKDSERTLAKVLMVNTMLKDRPRKTSAGSW
ncbi:MAG TPA: hypothetical protein VI932_00800 [Bacteroidota bacterium]|nr:hypothetical protein [Bacteroidota bacterium]